MDNVKFQFSFYSRLFIFCIIFALANTFSQNSHSQTKILKDRLTLGRDNAQAYLKDALTDRKNHNIISKKRIIIEKEADAVKIAETILFSIYSQKNIIAQRPYEIYNIDNHWIMMGTLPKGYLGGTFIIIIDACNGEVLRLSHGK